MGSRSVWTGRVFAMLLFHAAATQNEKLEPVVDATPTHSVSGIVIPCNNLPHKHMRITVFGGCLSPDLSWQDFLRVHRLLWLIWYARAGHGDASMKI